MPVSLSTAIAKHTTPGVTEASSTLFTATLQPQGQGHSVTPFLPLHCAFLSRNSTQNPIGVLVKSTG